jgi:hypothetical protein
VFRLPQASKLLLLELPQVSTLLLALVFFESGVSMQA